MTTETELAPLAPAQSVLYRFLTEAFRLPDAARLRFLAEWAPLAGEAIADLLDSGPAAGPVPSAGPVPAAAPGPAAGPVPSAGPVPDAAALARAVAEAQAMPLAQLQGAYTAAFVQGYPATPCRLLESVQREGQLIGESAEEAAMWYSRFGLAAQAEQADHLTCELEFLAYLTGTPVAGTEAERYRRARIKFAGERLAPWGRDLAGRIPAATPVALYRQAGALLGWLLAAEATLQV